FQTWEGEIRKPGFKVGGLLHSSPGEFSLSVASLRLTSLCLCSFQEDPALIRWTYARSANIYPNFRPTPKNSLLGAVAGFGPLIFWYYVFKTDRDRKERLIQEGKLDRKFNISY
uniref:NADH dehydrogenase [ubiquinone] 1 beta subcomplex subunit 4 n=1 Tax=Mus spicilegus TaxID=10103 RepID=A0A8C6MYE1_MUSSI